MRYGLAQEEIQDDLNGPDGAAFPDRRSDADCRPQGWTVFPTLQLEVHASDRQGHDGRVILASSASGLVAVKKFERSENTPRRTQRFFTEVSIMRSLSHPHLVPCYQAAMCDAYFAYSMPWYPGGDLTSVLRGHHPMDTATILRCMIEVSFTRALLGSPGCQARERVFRQGRPRSSRRPGTSQTRDHGIQDAPS
ncbi:AGC/AKT protein kinase [Elysia marginata]|uniref:AGC/AKT protein kinase n=1 Tax=Elysia marginata TaxID=1093978 RepID=A0AAV4H3E1_9GAST|nr:AGC/AKT protein kinase [Elysia marginata]